MVPENPTDFGTFAKSNDDEHILCLYCFKSLGKIQLIK